MNVKLFVLLLLFLVMRADDFKERLQIVRAIIVGDPNDRINISLNLHNQLIYISPYYYDELHNMQRLKPVIPVRLDLRARECRRRLSQLQALQTEFGGFFTPDVQERCDSAQRDLEKLVNVQQAFLK